MLGPRPGAQKRANKLNKTGLGRSLVNQKKKEKQNPGSSDRYTTDINPYGSQSALRSVTEQQPLDELLSTAELAGKDFTTERTAAVRVITQANSKPSGLTEAERQLLIKQHYDNAGKLTIPRRPQWSKDMSKEELDSLEKDAFLAWRRSLAELQESEDLKLAVTPFERNLEVWRQLWRVIERSDLVVQIVDARNPLLYRSEDLDNYVKQFDNKNVLLLVNKSDLLNNTQREIWKNYFVENNIPFAFYSAKLATDQQEKGETQDENAPVSNEPELSLQNTTRVLNVYELQSLFLEASPKIDDGKQLQIGLVGYPNVGKSSSINSLIGSKKVSVSSTPGKTKHFQTIKLSDELMLCDCPGLVFPNFAQTTAELVCQGVLPIDQLRDYMSPSALLVERLPKQFLEKFYGIKLHTDPVTALDFLNTYAKYRGFNRTGGGEPDSSRAARIVLKDYVNAKLPFCIPPPSYESSDHEFNKENYEHLLPNVQVESETGSVVDGVTKLQLQDQMLEEELDRSFFTGSESRGTATVPFHLRNTQEMGTKSSKKHHKGKKNKK
ncbi:putative GTPase [Starmerella bacillaris]|uniref:GTPase n=1 Tax=Starmerella bacillaris TaxID=1247836 RepID=A0AAV5REQ7_STABA|nr:putative GTPase [Starmerella bacillaris]